MKRTATAVLSALFTGTALVGAQQPQQQTNCVVLVRRHASGRTVAFFSAAPPLAPQRFAPADLFDSATGRMLTRQVILLSGDRITQVGPDTSVKIPAGTPSSTLAPPPSCPASSTRTRTCSTTRGREQSTEGAMLAAVQNAQRICAPDSLRRAT
jgi:hypothetical protein